MAQDPEITTPIQFRKHELSEAASIVLAGRLYERYCQHVGGRAFNGDPLPKWLAFSRDPSKAKQAEAWISIAREFGLSVWLAYSEQAGKAFQAGVTQGRLGWVPRAELDKAGDEMRDWRWRYQEARKRLAISRAELAAKAAGRGQSATKRGNGASKPKTAKRSKRG